MSLTENEIFDQYEALEKTKGSGLTNSARTSAKRPDPKKFDTARFRLNNNSYEQAKDRRGTKGRQLFGR